MRLLIEARRYLRKWLHRFANRCWPRLAAAVERRRGLAHNSASHGSICDGRAKVADRKRAGRHRWPQLEYMDPASVASIPFFSNEVR